jgi:hypothetical protein
MDKQRYERLDWSFDMLGFELEELFGEDDEILGMVKAAQGKLAERHMGATSAPEARSGSRKRRDELAARAGSNPRARVGEARRARRDHRPLDLARGLQAVLADSAESVDSPPLTRLTAGCRRPFGPNP